MKNDEPVNSSMSEKDKSDRAIIDLVFPPEPVVSQDQELVFTKSRVAALLQEIEDSIDEASENGPLDRREIKHLINYSFKEMFKPID